MGGGCQCCGLGHGARDSIDTHWVSLQELAFCAQALEGGFLGEQMELFPKLCLSGRHSCSHRPTWLLTLAVSYTFSLSRISRSCIRKERSIED